MEYLYLISIAVIIPIVLAVLVYTLFFNKGIFILFCKKIDDSYNVISSKKIKPTTTKIKLNKKLYKIDTSNTLFKRKNKTYIIVDVDSRQQLKRNDKNFEYAQNDWKQLDNMIIHETITKFSYGSMNKLTFDWNSIIFLFIGLVIGFSMMFGLQFVIYPLMVGA